MQTQCIAEALVAAKKFVAAADFVEQNYGTYVDGRGKEHYVNGPACKQLRDISIYLTYALSDMRRSTAAALPALPEENNDEGEAKDDGEYELQMDVATLDQPGWRQARVVRTK